MGQENTCEIHIRDNGVGIPPELHRSIFETFNRGAVDHETPGTGIGLAIVKKAVERAGGSIAVRSEVNKGTEFVVTLRCDASSLVPV